MVKEGNLQLSWDIVCPHCRGVRTNNLSLSAIEELNACDPCGITFDLNRATSIEVVFHVSPKLRKIKQVVYCAAEPAKKIHIKLNQEVPAKSSKSFTLNLLPGIYHLRTSERKNRVPIVVEEDCSEQNIVWDGKEVTQLKVNTTFEITLQNPLDTKEQFILEETWWFKDRLLVGEALSHPHIREIFSEDHLSIGVKLNVGNQVILFTDIVGSTPFYKKFGDALAMKAVQSHYQEVSQIIGTHGGVVVKFIGDAVMAAFLDVEKAMQAAINIHSTFPKEREDNPVKLRISLHEGKVLAANINVGVDYFGNTVNSAAKIQKHADAFQIAVCEEDWIKLHTKFPDLRVSEVIRDEKLELDLRVISLG